MINNQMQSIDVSDDRFNQIIDSTRPHSIVCIILIAFLPRCMVSVCVYLPATLDEPKKRGEHFNLTHLKWRELHVSQFEQSFKFLSSIKNDYMNSIM